MAGKVTRALGGEGLWGVEFFLAEDGVYFSELSPRPHDTGMVTLANTLPLNEFELHLRAVLGLPIPDISLQKAGASAVILASTEGVPNITGLEEALNEAMVDVKVFGKPVTRPYRRMAVALAWDKPGTDVKLLVAKAQSVAAKVKVH
jgi:phosphoribosylglycinamide formyltransferase 2